MRHPAILHAKARQSSVFAEVSASDFISDPKADCAHVRCVAKHPFHLHGYHFWVLGSGQGTYYDALNSSSLNTVNPPFRDVVSILKGGYAVLRFKARSLNLPGSSQRACSCTSLQNMQAPCVGSAQSRRIEPIVEQPDDHPDPTQKLPAVLTLGSILSSTLIPPLFADAMHTSLMVHAAMRTS
jgi:hypothetical protein